MLDVSNANSGNVDFSLTSSVSFAYCWFDSMLSISCGLADKAIARYVREIL